MEASLEAPVRIFDRRGWKAADFRSWGRGRPTLRDPDAPGWPAGSAGARTRDYEVALRWALRYVEYFREDVRRGQLKLGGRPRRLGEACEEYLRVRREEQRRPSNTVQVDRTALNHLRYHASVDAATGRKADDLWTDRVTLEFLQRLASGFMADEYAARTIRTNFDAISGFLRWLGHGDENAARHVKIPDPRDEGPLEPRVWSAAELVEIRRAADARDASHSAFRLHRRAVELALHAGLRRNELFGVEGKRIRPQDDTARVTHQLHSTHQRLVALKGKDSRVALLLPGWREHLPVGHEGPLLHRTDGRLVHPTQVSDLGTELLQAAGVHEPGLGWHSFRHTYATDFLLAGGKIQWLQKSLGHKSIATTEQYYEHVKSDAAAEQARREIYREGGVRLLG